MLQQRAGNYYSKAINQGKGVIWVEKEVGKIPQFVRFSTIKYRFLGLKPQYRNPFQGGALIRKPVFYTNFQT